MTRLRFFEPKSFFHWIIWKNFDIGTRGLAEISE